MRPAFPVLALLVLLAPAAAAEPLARIPNPRADGAGWVSDAGRQLRRETVAALNARIDAFERRTTGEAAVVVVRSLDGLSIEQTAERLFNTWGIGKQEHDNGLLFLWSVTDRRVRVEVGYGLEGVLPDGRVGALLDAHVMPRFRAGDYDGGVIAGMEQLLGVVEQAVTAEPDLFESRRGGWRRWLTWGLRIGGGLSAALAAFLGWGWWRRRRPRPCPACGRPLTRVVGDEYAHLEAGQLAEERVGSAEYTVWTCAGCSHRVVDREARSYSSRETCPQCTWVTLGRTEHVTSESTPSTEGTAAVLEECANCGFLRESTRRLPKKVESADRRSSSFDGGGGGSGFGGGSSGGGGASRSY